MSNVPDWQKTIRAAQQEAQRRADEANAEEAIKQAAKDAADGAALAKVLSKLLGFEIAPLPTNEWVSPDDIHFRLRSKDGSVLREMNARDTTKLCWWFELDFWMPPPEQYADLWFSYSMGTTGTIYANCNPIDGDWSPLQVDIAYQIDRVTDDWQQSVEMCSKLASAPARQSAETVHLGLPERLYTLIYEIVQDVVANQDGAEY